MYFSMSLDIFLMLFFIATGQAEWNMKQLCLGRDNLHSVQIIDLEALNYLDFFLEIELTYINFRCTT